MTQDTQAPIAAGRIEWQDQPAPAPVPADAPRVDPRLQQQVLDAVANAPSLVGSLRPATPNSSYDANSPSLYVPNRNYAIDEPDSVRDWSSDQGQNALKALKNGENPWPSALLYGIGRLILNNDHNDCSAIDDMQARGRGEESCRIRETFRR